jgi:ferredoxin, 2Fe-2S
VVAVTFKYADGNSTTIDIEPGSTVMQGAVRNGLQGIDADCGGALACATCHVSVAEEWGSKLIPPTEQELGMLEFAVRPEKGSRLSCQIEVDASLDGLIVYVPASQR